MLLAWLGSQAACTKTDTANVTSEIPCDGCVNAASLARGAVTAAAIAPGAVAQAAIAPGAITAEAIQEGAIHTTAIGPGSVGPVQIAGNAVGGVHLIDASVTSSKVASGAIGTTQISNRAITNPKIAVGAVTSTELASGAVLADHIAPGAVNSVHLASNAVLSANIAPASIGAIQLADGSVTPTKLAPLARVQAAGQSAGALFSFDSFRDMPGSTVSASHNGTSKPLVRASFSLFVGGIPANPGFELITVLLLRDGVPVGNGYSFAMNTARQHQSWSFDWLLPSPPAGDHAYKLQLRTTSPFVNNVAMDATDYVVVTLTET
jgi:hypothetical protein